MFASAISWSIDPPIADDADRQTLVHNLLNYSLRADRLAGAIDIIVTQLEPDLLMTFSMYDDLEDAFSAGQSELIRTAKHFSARLTLVSRVIGHAYDAPGFALVDRADVSLWRDDADELYTSVASWRLDDSLRPPAVLDAFLHARIEAYCDRLRDLGLLDMHVIRLADDVVLSVHFYARPLDPATAHEQAIATTQDVLDGRVTFVKGHTGPAYDVPQVVSVPY